MQRASRWVRLVTVAVPITSLAVAVLAAAPRSPLTPPLLPGDDPVRPLDGVARAVGLDGLSPEAAAWVAGAVMAAAVSAFLGALLLAWRGAISVRRVVWLAAGLHLLLLAVPLVLSRDVYSYGLYGRMVAQGLNPYVTAPSALQGDPLLALASPEWVGSPTVYGPAFTLLSAGLTGVVRGPAAQAHAFELLAAAASLTTVLLVVAAARRVHPERAAFAGVLVGWSPVVLFHTVGGAHNDALVGGGVAAGVLLMLSRRWRWATALLAAAAMIKLTAAVPLLMAVIAGAAARPVGRRLRELGLHAAIIVAVGVPFSLPFVREDPTLGTAELASREGWMAPFRLIRRAVGAVAPGGVAAAGTVLRVAFAALVVAAAALVARHLWRRGGDPLAAVTGMGWVTLVALLSAPVLLPWYLPVVLPAAWALPRLPRSGVVLLSAVLAVTMFVAERSRSPAVWDAMVLGVRYVAAPVALLLLIRVALDLRRRLAIGPSSPGPDALASEFPSAPATGGGSGPQRIPAQDQDRGQGHAPAGEREPRAIGHHPGQDEDPRPR